MTDENNNLVEIINSVKNSSYQLSTFFKNFRHALNDFADRYRRIIVKFNDPNFIKRILSGIEEYTNKLSEATKYSIVILAQHGWFISLEMPPSPIIQCATSILDGDINNVDLIMTSYYQNVIGEINDTLNKNFPNRSKIFSDAFEAHQRQRYNLSIPIFLIQSDGICNEIIGYQLYSRRKNKPKTATYANRFQHDSFLSALLEPFRISLPLTASEQEREILTIDNYLNRHEILHGESCNYGTEVNSLKSISLINFVSSVLLKANKGN